MKVEGSKSLLKRFKCKNNFNDIPKSTYTCGSIFNIPKMLHQFLSSSR